MKQPEVKSRRQHLRLWFEFYKLALDNPDLQANLEKVRDFYAPWGDPRGVDFREWWKDHAYLFGATRVEEITKVSKAPNVIHLSVPLNLAVSKSLPEIKALIEAKQRDRLLELGQDPTAAKSLAAGFGTYEFTAKELRGRPLYEALTMYQLWLAAGRPKIGHGFCQYVVDELAKRPRAKWLPSYLLRVPTADKKGNLRFAEEQLRQMRRSIVEAEKVCVAVSKGRFPE